MKKKRGISLIVLIITLVVILIIVAIIVLNLKNTDPVGKANEVKLRSDFKSLNEEFLATISDLSMSNSSFTKEDINISASNVNKMRLYIPSITQEYANKLYDELNENGISVILDDRKERPGVKFNDMDLIGIPIRVTIGRKFNDGIVELKLRDQNEMKEVAVDDLLEELKKMTK